MALLTIRNSEAALRENRFYGWEAEVFAQGPAARRCDRLLRPAAVTEASSKLSPTPFNNATTHPSHNGLLVLSCRVADVGRLASRNEFLNVFLCRDRIQPEAGEDQCPLT